MNTNTITDLAVRYADAQNTADRAAVRLTEHADWNGYVARVVKGNRAELAREILGLDYVPVKNVKSDARDFRRVETLATLLGRHAAKNNESTPDWLALAVSAASNAHAQDKGNLSSDEILKAIKAALTA